MVATQENIVTEAEVHGLGLLSWEARNSSFLIPGQSVTFASRRLLEGFPMMLSRLLG
jgi:hypothetical protein